MGPGFFSSLRATAASPDETTQRCAQQLEILALAARLQCTERKAGGSTFGPNNSECNKALEKLKEAADQCAAYVAPKFTK